MRAAEIFALGYAVPMRDIKTERDYWEYENERFDLKIGAVPVQQLDGVSFYVARIEDVRRVANGEWPYG